MTRYFLIIWFLTGANLFSQISNNLERAEKFLSIEDFYNAKKVLEKVKVQQGASTEDCLRYNLGLAKVNICEKNYSKALDYLNKARYYSDQDKDLQKKYNHFSTVYGELFYSIGANDLAISWYKKYSMNLTKDIDKQFIYSRIGSFFYELMDFDNAEKYFKKQLDCSRTIENNYYYELSAMNNIALVYLKKKDYKVALEKFLTIESELAKKFKKNDELSIAVKENIGVTHHFLGNDNLAIQYLEPLMEPLKNKKSSTITLTTVRHLGRSYLNLGMLNEALQIEKIMCDYMPKLTSENQIILTQFQLEIYTHKKSFEKVKEFHKKLDSLLQIYRKEKRLSQNLSSGVVSSYLIYESDLRIKIAEKEKRAREALLVIEKKENVLLFISFICVVLVSLVSFYLYRQRSLNIKTQLQIKNDLHKLEEAKLNQQINIQNKYLTDFAIGIQQKSKLYEECIKELKVILAQSTDNIKGEVQKMTSEMIHKAMVNKQMLDIDDTTKALIIDFKNRLTSISSELTNSDIELCCYIKLQLSNKEIALFKGINPDSVKIRKHRLKKKLNLQEGQDLSNFISNV
jgi:tetratricopeptide (TPR) repeat protein